MIGHENNKSEKLDLAFSTDKIVVVGLDSILVIKKLY